MSASREVYNPLPEDKEPYPTTEPAALPDQMAEALGMPQADEWQDIPADSQDFLALLIGLYQNPEGLPKIKSALLAAYQMGRTDGIIAGLKAGGTEALNDRLRASIAAQGGN